MAEAPAVLADANALASTIIRNILMELAVARTIRLHWSPMILIERKRAILKRPGALEADIDTATAAMNRTLSTALVEPLPLDQITATLPDPDDRHVLAAALAAECAYIVTDNVKDFPAAELAREPRDVRAVKPDTFFIGLATNHPEPVLSTLMAVQRVYKNPSLDDEAFQQRLRRAKLVETASFVRLFHNA